MGHTLFLSKCKKCLSISRVSESTIHNQSSRRSFSVTEFIKCDNQITNSNRTSKITTSEQVNTWIKEYTWGARDYEVSIQRIIIEYFIQSLNREVSNTLSDSISRVIQSRVEFIYFSLISGFTIQRLISLHNLIFFNWSVQDNAILSIIHGTDLVLFSHLTSFIKNKSDTSSKTEIIQFIKIKFSVIQQQILCKEDACSIEYIIRILSPERMVSIERFKQFTCLLINTVRVILDSHIERTTVYFILNKHLSLEAIKEIISSYFPGFLQHTFIIDKEVKCFFIVLTRSNADRDVITIETSRVRSN